ncbi:MAG: hypothetical protein OXI01_04560 [Albidovulum sp.]|nr:hypothetical protein [Albidovulum sp.]
MRHLILAAFVVAIAGSQALACDDHQGACEIEAWRYQLTAGILTIDGSVTCNSGMVSIRLYDGETYLGNAQGFVQGHALTAVATGIANPDKLQIKYSIQPE